MVDGQMWSTEEVTWCPSNLLTLEWIPRSHQSSFVLKRAISTPTKPKTIQSSYFDYVFTRYGLNLQMLHLFESWDQTAYRLHPNSPQFLLVRVNANYFSIKAQKPLLETGPGLLAQSGTAKIIKQETVMSCLVKHQKAPCLK